MNTYLLTGFVLVMFFAVTAGLWLLFAFIRRRYGIRVRFIRWLALGTLACGVLVAWFVFTTDYRMRVTTLHEEIVAGTLDLPAGSKSAQRLVGFAVEHPGVEHTLFICPLIGSGIWAQFDVQIAFRLEDDQGRVLLDRTYTFKPAKPKSRLVSIPEWQGAEWRFTPQTTGSYRVIVVPQTMRIPKIFVRISDPAKHNGERLPGY